MIPVSADASSIILLEKVRLFQKLSTHFSIRTAPSVFHEIVRTGYPGAGRLLQGAIAGQMVIQPVKNSCHGTVMHPPVSMDKGEADTLSLYLQTSTSKKGAGFILTDDGRAARWCYKKGLPFINALLVPKIFWYAECMSKDDAVLHMKQICSIGRYSDKVKTFAFDCTKKDLSFFIPE